MSDTQATIDGDAPEGEVFIYTHARVARPLCAPLSAITDELVVTADPDGLTASVVDPANVAHVDVRVYPAAFDQYTAPDEGMAIGVPTRDLASVIGDAHMTVGDPDPVAITLYQPSITVAIDKDYGDTTVQRHDEVYAFDPDSVRQPDGMVGERIDGNEWQATIDTRALVETVEHLGQTTDRVAVRESDGALVLASAGDTDGYGSTATIPDVATAMTADATAGAASRLSIDYLSDIATAIEDAKCDSVTIEWATECPVVFRSVRTIDGELAYEVTFGQAPLVGGDS